MANIKLGVVGLGRGSGLARIAAAHPQVELVALCDRNIQHHVQPGSLVDQLRKEGIVIEKTYADFDEMLEHDLDAVIVGTPPACHAEQSIAALNRGLHVLSEIPAAMSFEEGRNLVAAVRKSDRVYMMGENCCWWGFVKTWRKWVTDGTVGKPFYLEGQYIHDLGMFIEPDMIKRTYPLDSPEAATGATWRSTFEPIRYCTHETGPLLDIAGDRIARIMAVSTGSNVRPEIGTLDMQMAMGRTAQGTVIKLAAGFSLAREPAHHYFCMYGPNGFTEFRNDKQMKLFQRDLPGLASEMVVPIGCQPVEQPPKWAAGMEGHGGADPIMIAGFLAAILDGAPVPIDVYRGLDYSLPGIAAAESARTDESWIEIPDPRDW